MTTLTLEQQIANWISETETDVQNVVTKVIQNVEVGISEVESALKWVASQVPSISTAIQNAVAFIESIGLTANPEVAAAVAAANVAVQGLNAFAAAENSATTASGAVNAVVAGYQAVKTAQAAVASATAAAVKVTVPASTTSGSSS